MEEEEEEEEGKEEEERVEKGRGKRNQTRALSRTCLSQHLSRYFLSNLSSDPFEQTWRGPVVGGPQLNVAKSLSTHTHS